MITLLDQETINKIAAGEVIERPSAVVKELLENAVDAGANSITVEIKEGGTSFMRITDNGTGMESAELSLAFKRHSTSKIKSAEDLMTVKSLGFRGEALSSIAAVSQVELLTKTAGSLTGFRYVIEGGEEKTKEEIGCPEGTTFIVRNLFYNTPARRKFLKSSMTEAGYVADLVERIAISHPDISFKFINNNQVRLQTSGNHNLKDIIYHIYGRDITAQLLSVATASDEIKLYGFIGKPLVSRGNRNYMNYFVNGRYIKSNIINRAIEEAYKPYTMSHRYPFTILSFELASSFIDINVHPTKMEVRFTNQEDLFRLTYDTITAVLKGKDLIPEISLPAPKQEELKEAKEKKQSISSAKTILEKGPEPFEKKRMESVFINKVPSYVSKTEEEPAYHVPVQMELFQKKEVSHRIIGQLFSTYWMVEYQDKMYIIDQHAAHEKVLFEKTMNALKNQEILSQMLNPPIILTLNMREEEALFANKQVIKNLGFEIDPFGGKEYSVSAVPSNLCNIAQKELLLEMLDDLVALDVKTSGQLLTEKVASMSCKAAVKGNHMLSELEAHKLIDELMALENPYHCPHGRPVIVSMSKYEIEKKFKRIL